MNKYNARKKELTDLRLQAEEIMRERADDIRKISDKDVQSLIHELKVHQIELEMQNEELRRVQIELQESRNRYSDLYDFAPIGYFTFDKNGVILEVNLTGAAKLGMGRSLLIKKPFSLYIAPDNKDVFYLHLRQVFKTKTHQTSEIKLMSKDGTQFDAQLESMSVQDGEGKSGQCRTAISDITERRQAENDLRKARDELEIRVEERTAELMKSEQRWVTTLKSIGDAVVSTDIHGRITFMNIVAESLTGWSLAEAQAKPASEVFNIINEYSRRKPDDPVSRVLKEGSISGISNYVTLVKKDGTELPIYDSCAQIRDVEGNTMGAVLVFRDITKRRKLDEALKRAQEELEIRVQERTAQLKESLEEKEILLREIHHRVKNNMQVISGLLMLQEEYSNDEKVNEMIKESQNRIDSMSLIHEKLYRSESISKIDFKEYVDDLVSGLFESYGITGSKVGFKVNAENINMGIDTAIPCGLIINELVSNSLKHAFPAGKKGEIEIFLRSTDDNIFELLARDNGVGIPEGIDFRKTESLGLHIVNILVENQLHGEITMNKNNGTEFRIRFRGMK
jgi:PAS domain S-box-containing protein